MLQAANQRGCAAVRVMIEAGLQMCWPRCGVFLQFFSPSWIIQVGPKSQAQVLRKEPKA